MYLTQIPGRLVFLIGAMLIGGNADLWVLRPDLRPVMILVGALATLLGGLLLRAAWTSASTTERRTTRWMIAGALLSAIPFAGSPIGARCIIVPWIGGAFVISLVLSCWWTTLRRRPGLSYRLLSVACWGLAALHLVLAPLQRLATPFLLRRMMFEELAASVQAPELGSSPVAGRTLLILNAPDLRIGLHAYFFRQLYRLPMPASWRVLSWAPCAHRFRRTAPDTLEMELLGCELEAPFLREGEIIETSGMQATVVQEGRNGPQRVRFQFDRPLDDRNLLWLIWKDGRLQSVEPPPIGGTLELPRELVDSL
jgi:hypothetical protein